MGEQQYVSFFPHPHSFLRSKRLPKFGFLPFEDGTERKASKIGSKIQLRKYSLPPLPIPNVGIMWNQ